MSNRTQCPSCPDGNEWNSEGPTGRACQTCKGRAYLEQDADREMFGDEPEQFGLENVGNK